MHENIRIFIAQLNYASCMLTLLLKKKGTKRLKAQDRK